MNFGAQIITMNNPRCKATKPGLLRLQKPDIDAQDAASRDHG
jgi:hypothetical protein